MNGKNILIFILSLGFTFLMYQLFTNPNLLSSENIEQYMPYYIFGVVILTALFFLFTKAKKFLKIFKALFGLLRGMRLDPKSTLSDQEKAAISISAIYSVQQDAYVNTLQTGLSKGDVQNLLFNWWSIKDSQQAIETLDYLQNKGYQFYFPHVLEAFQQKQLPEEFLATRFPIEEDFIKGVEQTYNLNECYEELINDRVIQRDGDLASYGVGGWDYGRLVFVTRLCYDYELISEAQAWQYINYAYAQTQKKFNSWQAFSKSYIIGRALWGGKGTGNSGIAAIADDLLENAKSPWKVALSQA